MQLPKLNPRLARLIDFMPNYFERLVDVGADHCYLPLHLLAQGKTNQILAIECKEGPLEQGKRHARRFGFIDAFEFKLANGLRETDVLPTDWVVIAGMGGLEIRDILNEANLPAGVQLVLQPMKSTPELRKFLFENGFVICNEQLAWSKGYFYPLIHVAVDTAYTNSRRNNTSPTTFARELTSEDREQDFEINFKKNRVSDLELDIYIGPILRHHEYHDAVTRQLWPAYRSKELRRAARIAASSGEELWSRIADFYREENEHED